MTWVYSDGGRSATNLPQKPVRDCVVRSIAIATELDYYYVWSEAKRLMLVGHGGANIDVKRITPDYGVFRATYDVLLAQLGWAWTPTMRIGSGCRVHLTSQELPPGRLVVKVSRHLTAVVDGVVYDTHDPSRDGKRCVYGYYQRLAR